MKKYLAEMIGTFTLTFAIITSLSGYAPGMTPLVAALALGLMVYIFGDVSGSNLNPAVTIGLLSARKIAVKDAIGYIVAQIAGSVLAMLIGRWIFGGYLVLPLHNTSKVAFAEALGAFFLVLGVCAVIFERVKPAASGIVIGGSLMLGIAAASAVSNGVLNPAVALGIGSFSLIYALAPVIGGIAAVWIFKFVAGPVEVEYK